MADGLTSERLITKDRSADLPEPYHSFEHQLLVVRVIIDISQSFSSFEPSSVSHPVAFIFTYFLWRAAC